MQIRMNLTVQELRPHLDRFFDLSARKIRALESTWKPADGAPVFTVRGRYTTRGWTEWTQGFQYGAALLQFDATGEGWFLDVGRRHTVERMTPHLTHTGVHDHGFNNVSTYGNLWRMAQEGLFEADPWEVKLYELALAVSGAVQASRWSEVAGGYGFIYSFNGPHSLFVDTIRSLRSLALAHQLGHHLMGEGDRRVSLLERLVRHARTTARYNLYFGEGRDIYDVRGRVAHESIFNTKDGSYRCPSTQQGYSPFSTWTRGLAWALAGFAEQLEFVASRPPEEFEPFGGQAEVIAEMCRAAEATADFYIENTPADGVPYWDTGAPGLERLGDWRLKPSDPENPYEPVDSSAAAIAAQGLIRLGRYLKERGARKDEGDGAAGRRYYQAGLTVAATLLGPPYLSEDDRHQGLLLHSVYHRPNGWDFTPQGPGTGVGSGEGDARGADRTARVPRGESSMWGDYHARELALMLLREAENRPYLRFFGPPQSE